MSKREKIIVVIMVLSVVYGVYALVFEDKKQAGAPEKPQEKAVLAQFVAQIKEGMTNGGGTTNDTYILQRAETPWKGDPFVASEMALTPTAASLTEKEGQPLPKFAYSGYLSMGDRNLAIIDGQEYGVGEALEPSGLVVKQISPVQVVLALPDGRPDVIVILEETQ